jgi:Rieske 2Fe-2S family protein
VETISADGTRSGRSYLPGLSEDDRTTVHFLHFFPGLLIGLYPDHVSVQWYFPTGTDSSESGAEWLFGPEDARRDNGDIYDFVTMVLQQDWDVCERVQSGLRSGGYRGGVFTDRERRSHVLDWIVADTYVTGRRPASSPVTFGPE